MNTWDAWIEVWFVLGSWTCEDFCFYLFLLKSQLVHGELKTWETSVLKFKFVLGTEGLEDFAYLKITGVTR